MDFKIVLDRAAVVIGIDKTKLSLLGFAKEKLQEWSEATYIEDNIRIVEPQ